CALRKKTMWQTLSRSKAMSKLDLRRRPPLAKPRTLPNSRVNSVVIRLVSDQSVPRTTSARAFSAGIRALYATTAGERHSACPVNLTLHGGCHAAFTECLRHHLAVDPGGGGGGRPGPQ